jgi:hypothetical protein
MIFKWKSQQSLDNHVVKSNEIYHGKSYGDLVKSFVQWLVSYNPDNQSLSDVFFLRGVDFEGYKGSLNHRFVKIGKNSLQVYSDQAIFFPVITSFADDIHHRLETPEKRRDYVYQLIQVGDDPPAKTQFSIDGLNPNLNWGDHYVLTNDFNIYIPEPQEGKTLGQKLDVPLNIPGPAVFVAGGYFVLLKPLEVGTHIIAFYGKGDFDYRNSTFVELNVVERETKHKSSSLLPGDRKSLLSVVESGIRTRDISNADDYYEVLRSIGINKQEITESKARAKKRIDDLVRIEEWKSEPES